MAGGVPGERSLLRSAGRNSLRGCSATVEWGDRKQNPLDRFRWKAKGKSKESGAQKRKTVPGRRMRVVGFPIHRGGVASVPEGYLNLFRGIVIRKMRPNPGKKKRDGRVAPDKEGSIF